MVHISRHMAYEPEPPKLSMGFEVHQPQAAENPPRNALRPTRGELNEFELSYFLYRHCSTDI